MAGNTGLCQAATPANGAAGAGAAGAKGGSVVDILDEPSAEQREEAQIWFEAGCASGDSPNFGFRAFGATPATLTMPPFNI